MLGTVLGMALLSADCSDPIQTALDHFDEVNAYQATLKSVGSGNNEIIRYYFKKPGYVRMEFVTPFKGMVLVYDPVSRYVKLWPFGYGSFPAFSLRPDNGMIRSSTGQRVDRSDVGVLFRNVKTLQGHGVSEVLGVETLGDSQALHMEISSDDGFSLQGISRYHIWLDRLTGFPLKVMSYAGDGGLIEAVELQGVGIDQRFPDGFFRQ